ncbi:MAG TPA: DUF4388 domain-containing protein [Vicinamibacteria bacterium]|nr:DUF4388 domain-containing protein [Vicinamibacteria bacterium]
MSFEPEGALPDDDLTLRGEIETSSVPELLRSFLASGEAGILTFRQGDVAKSLYLQEGKVVYAASSDPDERLGEHLLVKGRITVRHYVEASKLIRPGRRLGAILVELEAIESEELVPAVEQQVRDLLVELMTWTHGDYELVMKEIDPATLVTVNIPLEGIVLEGLRRSRSWSQIARGLGGIDVVPVRTGNTEVLYKLDLTEEEQDLLSRVNGASSVEQICQMSYLSNFETCRILWAFKVLGLVRIGQEADAEHVRERERELDLEEIVEKFNQMFGRIYTFLQGRHGEAADSFMEAALEQVSAQYGALFDGVDLRHYGRADFEQMLANVADLPPEQRRSLMVSALNELVYAIQLAARQRHGAEEEAVISGIIKDGLKRLGTGA